MKVLQKSTAFSNERKTVLGPKMSQTSFGSTVRLLATSMTMAFLILTVLHFPSANVNALSAPKKMYRYFGYGSNVIPSTMKALRQIDVREVTAAILPNYELKFQSAAFVRPVHVANQTESDRDTNEKHEQVVHGLLYTLTEDEFAKVGRTEGVPFGYRWQSCRVYPYQGDGKSAGIDCLNDPEATSVQAYTLVEPTPASSQQKQQQQQRRKRAQLKNGSQGGSIPPSSSYLGLIREGARLWKFDRAYQDELATIQTAKPSNLLFPGGWEGPTLQLAEKATGIERTYMIDGF